MQRICKPLGGENHPSAHTCSRDATLCSDEEVCRWIDEELKWATLSVHEAETAFTCSFILLFAAFCCSFRKTIQLFAFYFSLLLRFSSCAWVFVRSWIGFSRVEWLKTGWGHCKHLRSAVHCALLLKYDHRPHLPGLKLLLRHSHAWFACFTFIL